MFIGARGDEVQFYRILVGFGRFSENLNFITLR